jgi:hypothetical protein
MIGITGLAKTVQTAVENGLNQSISVSFNEQLKFHIPGAVGFYPAVKPVNCIIQASMPIQIQFLATPLSLVSADSKESGSLNVTYWVNQYQKDQMSFKPQGTPLTLYRNFSNHKAEEFILYGGIKIDRIDEQPAGVYNGTIYITVSAKGKSLN